nr:SonI [Paraconiothyrium archidendri]
MHSETILTRAVELLKPTNYYQLAATVFGLYFAWSLIVGRKQNPTVAGAPVVGKRWAWEPAILLQLRFVFGAFDIISDGYNKLKNSPYVVRRYDADITVLPAKYLEEVRLMPRNKLNSKIPQVANLVPKWTFTEFMYHSELIFRVLNNKLTPELNKYVDLAKSELEYAWDLDLPKPEEWTEVDIQQSIRMLVSRMSAKVFVGYPACRDMEWLKVSIDFSIDLFMTAFTMRTFPPWLHPIVAWLIPARWRLRSQMGIGKRVVANVIRKYKTAKAEGYEPEETLLGWMIDNGTDKENDIDEMAARQCALTLASIHTTALAASNFLFDLCAHPEWFPVLIEEIQEVSKEYGRLGTQKDMTTRQWLAKLEKMDSFLVESQRSTPPILLRPQRYALTNVTLKDGTKIPQGARIAWAGHHHANDPNTVDDPDSFDPMRNYRKRYAGNGENKLKFTAGQSDPSSLAFGYGGQACPGRYFAVHEIKMLIARLLSEYDFKYPEGKSRPATAFADENVFIDTDAKLMMKVRPEV